MDMVAIGRVVLTKREHMVALEPMEKWASQARCLRYRYDVRSEADYFARSRTSR
jgi:DNA end-binding protein Ku